MSNQQVSIEWLLTGFGPVGIFVVLFLMGRIVAKATHDDVKAQRDRWQAVAEEAVRQNSKLLESARVADRTFKALEKVAGMDTT